MINLNFSFENINIPNFFKKKRFYGSLLTILLSLIVGYFTHDFDFKFKKSLVKSGENKVKIEDKLEEIRIRSDAHYVAINFIDYKTNTMQRVYEAKESGKPRLTNLVAKYPIESFKNSFLLLKTNEWLYILNSKQYKDDKYLAYVISRIGCVTVLYVALQNEQEVEDDGRYKFIGYMSYEFHEETLLTPEQINNMVLERNLLTPLIWK